MRAKKLRERINSAATEANQAAQIALQKTAIAMARSDVSPHSRFTGPGFDFRMSRFLLFQELDVRWVRRSVGFGWV